MKAYTVNISDIAEHPHLSFSAKDYTLILCPLKETNVYRWVCYEKCTWNKESKKWDKKSKCPLEK
jgi:hypothetical protein